MRHYLVVANETLDDPAFEEWVARRLAVEPVHVHLVVPPNRTEGRIHWHEEEATDRARRRPAEPATASAPSAPSSPVKSAPKTPSSP